ncbi:uncharacterized protein At5g01610-like [Magnolia sinica]|uniref:uncharacterized protein At5g01610-like n=1 Tax=Magnolia sinica TaxID=86752 RepID=UPI00265A448A|nr:uncharacterized protein At5g01610-like [Magnolia sinica]
MGISTMPKSKVAAAILCIWVVSIAASVDPSSVSTDTPTAYEVLQEYDFPKGLLPKGATGYDLDRSTGKFSAYLNGSCSFSLEGSYQLKYKSTIKGTISKDKLTDLSGVSVKVLFFWVNIIEVTRSGNELDFSVGILSASFPISNFLECPQCGCGLNCLTLRRDQGPLAARQVRTSRLVDFS